MKKINNGNKLLKLLFNILKKIICLFNYLRKKNKYRKQYKLTIFFFFLTSNISLFLYKLIFINLKKIQVCLCVLGKKENNYAREFVEHYKLYGVDKIFIYDNNDINGEKFENVLSDYISNQFVEIINYRGKNQKQIQMLNECYNNNFEKYDWFIMYDMDEFINLKNHINIKNYLKRIKFNKCNVIYFFRAFHTDNNQLYYKNKTLFERFPNSVYNTLSVKPIVRGHINNLIIDNNHLINGNIKSCYSLGEKKNKQMDFKNYFIDHFYFKSTEEFIDKINRGDSFYNNTDGLKLGKINYYFASNNITLEKINYIEKETGINLTKFKQKINITK